jgi:hypothetical protein
VDIYLQEVKQPVRSAAQLVRGKTAGSRGAEERMKEVFLWKDEAVTMTGKTTGEIITMVKETGETAIPVKVAGVISMTGITMTEVKA